VRGRRGAPAFPWAALGLILLPGQHAGAGGHGGDRGCGGFVVCPVENLSSRVHRLGAGQLAVPAEPAAGQEALAAPLADQVGSLDEAQRDADAGGDHHEEGEDVLLGGSGDEAVHHVGAGGQLALHHPGQGVVLVEAVEDVEEDHVHASLADKAEQVGPPQPAPFLAGVGVDAVAAIPSGSTVPLLLALPVGHVHDDQKGWTGHQDQLQGPEADVGDGEEVVEADVAAARLLRVAVKVLVVIAPDPLGRHHVDQQAEDEDEGEPDAAEGRGVLVDPTEEPFEHPPVHGAPIPLASLGGERQYSHIEQAARGPRRSTCVPQSTASHLGGLRDHLPPLLAHGDTHQHVSRHRPGLGNASPRSTVPLCGVPPKLAGSAVAKAPFSQRPPQSMPSSALHHPPPPAPSLTSLPSYVINFPCVAGPGPGRRQKEQPGHDSSRPRPLPSLESAAASAPQRGRSPVPMHGGHGEGTPWSGGSGRAGGAAQPQATPRG